MRGQVSTRITSKPLPYIRTWDRSHRSRLGADGRIDSGVERRATRAPAPCRAIAELFACSRIRRRGSRRRRGQGLEDPPLPRRLARRGLPAGHHGFRSRRRREAWGSAPKYGGRTSAYGGRDDLSAHAWPAVGETSSDGKRAFVLTLRAEQNSVAKRRANICTNEALIALQPTYTSPDGKRGLGSRPQSIRRLTI